LVLSSHPKYSVMLAGAMGSMFPTNLVVLHVKAFESFRVAAPHFKAVPLAKRLREMPEDYEKAITKMREYVIKLERDMQRNKLIVEERQNSLSKLLLTKV
jgi:hypothetical protein